MDFMYAHKVGIIDMEMPIVNMLITSSSGVNKTRSRVLMCIIA